MTFLVNFLSRFPESTKAQKCPETWELFAQIADVVLLCFPISHCSFIYFEDCTLSHLFHQNSAESTGVHQTQLLNFVSVTWAKLTCLGGLWVELVKSGQ